MFELFRTNFKFLDSSTHVKALSVKVIIVDDVYLTGNCGPLPNVEANHIKLWNFVSISGKRSGFLNIVYTVATARRSWSFRSCIDDIKSLAAIKYIEQPLINYVKYLLYQLCKRISWQNRSYISKRSDHSRASLTGNYNFSGLVVNCQIDSRRRPRTPHFSFSYNVDIC